VKKQKITLPLQSPFASVLQFYERATYHYNHHLLQYYSFTNVQHIIVYSLLLPLSSGARCHTCVLSSTSHTILCGSRWYSWV